MRISDARIVLARATAQAGGVPQLAAMLELSPRVLRHYLEGREAIPDALVLQVVDVILKDLPEPPPQS